MCYAARADKLWCTKLNGVESRPGGARRRIVCERKSSLGFVSSASVKPNQKSLAQSVQHKGFHVNIGECVTDLQVPDNLRRVFILQLNKKA